MADRSHPSKDRITFSNMQHSVILLLGLFASAFATPFQDCGSLGSEVSMTVEDCDEPPCILERGRTYLVNFKFGASAYTETLEIDATANIGGIEVPWPGIDTNACDQLEGTENPCPLEEGSAVDWTMEAEVLIEYPKIETVVTFKLVDSAGGSQTCAKLTAIIV